MESNLNTLQDNINQLKTCFGQIRDEAVSKLNQCDECIQTAEKLCRQAIEMTTIAENKLVNVSNEEKEWKDIKVKLATTSIKGKVILDVGGEKYTTSVKTLTRVKDTFFTALFSKQWELEHAPDDKSIFIDRDGKLFNHILAYLRTNKISNDIFDNESLCRLLVIEAEYFHLHDLLGILKEAENKFEKEKERKLQVRTNKNFPNGTLLQPYHKMKLSEFYGDCDEQWELIYKASRDGFDANAFHSRCNNKGPTMTIIQSNNNYLFGGYTSLPWTSDLSYKNDTTAFLFTLTNPHNIPPTKYTIQTDKTPYAVYHSSCYGPAFGKGNDINLSSSSNLNNSSYVNFPNSYTDTTGKGNATFTGAKNFTTSDIEVYKIA